LFIRALLFSGDGFALCREVKTCVALLTAALRAKSALSKPWLIGTYAFLNFYMVLQIKLLNFLQLPESNRYLPKEVQRFQPA